MASFSVVSSFGVLRVVFVVKDGSPGQPLCGWPDFLHLISVSFGWDLQTLFQRWGG